MFPGMLLQRTLRHLSGYANAAQKLMCARTEGLLDDPPSGPSERPVGRLLYAVSFNTSLDDQKTAIASALVLAEHLRHALVLPTWVHHGKKFYPFCRVFDANRLPPHLVINAVDKRTRRLLCNAAGLLDATALATAPAVIVNSTPSSGRLQSSMLPAKCVTFSSLLQLATNSTDSLRDAQVQRQAKLRTCHPNDKRVMGSHACFSSAYLESPRPKILKRPLHDEDPRPKFVKDYIKRARERSGYQHHENEERLNPFG